MGKYSDGVEIGGSFPELETGSFGGGKVSSAFTDMMTEVATGGKGSAKYAARDDADVQLDGLFGVEKSGGAQSFGVDAIPDELLRMVETLKSRGYSVEDVKKRLKGTPEGNEVIAYLEKMETVETKKAETWKDFVDDAAPEKKDQTAATVVNVATGEIVERVEAEPEQIVSEDDILTQALEKHSNLPEFVRTKYDEGLWVRARKRLDNKGLSPENYKDYWKTAESMYSAMRKKADSLVQVLRENTKDMLTEAGKLDGRVKDFVTNSSRVVSLFREDMIGSLAHEVEDSLRFMYAEGYNDEKVKATLLEVYGDEVLVDGVMKSAGTFLNRTDLTYNDFHRPVLSPTRVETDEEKKDRTAPKKVTTKVRKEGSIIDYPKEVLDETVWEVSGEVPVMREDVKGFIMDLLDMGLKMGSLLPEKVKGVYVKGSETTYQYGDDSDVDVEVWYDVGSMGKRFNGEDISGLSEDEKGYMITVFFNKGINEKLIPGTKHPVSFYFLPESTLEDSFSVYDLKKDAWVKMPEKPPGDFNKDELLEKGLSHAQEWAHRLDDKVGETKRDIRELDYFASLYEKMDFEGRRAISDKMWETVREIEEKIHGLIGDYDKIHSERLKVFDGSDSEGMAGYLFSKDWHPANIAWKFLERWRYITLLKRLKDLERDKGKGDKGYVENVKEVVTDTGEEDIDAILEGVDKEGK